MQTDGQMSNPADTLTLSVDDATGPNGVVTVAGQETIRDAFVGDTTNQSVSVAYGSGGGNPSESDTSLTTQEVQRPYTGLDIIRAAQLDTSETVDWTDLFDFPDDQPYGVENDTIVTYETCLYRLTQNFATESGGTFITSDANASEGTAYEFSSEGDRIEFQVDLDYTVPLRDETDDASEWLIQSRAKAMGSDPVSVSIYTSFDETIATGGINPTESYGWETDTFNETRIDTTNPGTYSLIYECTNDNAADAVRLDLGVLEDRRFFHTFPNTITDGSLSGPQRYPDQVSIQSRDVTPPQKLIQADLTTSFNDISNSQGISLTLGDSPANVLNSETLSVSTSPATQPVSVGLTLSRFATDTTTTPTQGDTGQEVSLVDIDGDVEPQNITDVGRQDVELVFPDSVVNGLTLGEVAQLNNSGETLTRSLFPDIAPSGEDVIFSEDIGFDID